MFSGVGVLLVVFSVILKLRFRWLFCGSVSCGWFMVIVIRLLRVFWVCGKLLFRYCCMLVVLIDSWWLDMVGVVCVLMVVVRRMV